MSKQTNIWFNQNLSVINTFLIPEILKNNSEELNIYYSHSSDKETEANFLLEPNNLSEDEYIEFCLNTCKEYKIDIFYPWKNIEYILKKQEEFNKIGVKVYGTVDSKLVFNIINNKSSFYSHISNDMVEGDKINIPPYFSVSSKEGFFEKADELLKNYKDICTKPAIGIFASGYKRIFTDGKDFQRMLNGVDKYTIGYEELKLIMPEKIPQMLVMKFLNGNEYSHDCFCHKGKIIASGIRIKYIGGVKHQDVYSPEQNKEIFKQSKLLVKDLGLSGFINIQYIDDEMGVPNVLEINPRMSGGFYKLNKSGIEWGDIFKKTLLNESFEKIKIKFNYSTK